MSKQTKITKSAKDQDCQIRIPGHCNFNPETTVFCHVGGGGMGYKSSDIHGAYGCSNCHDIVDGRYSTMMDKSTVNNYIYEGVFRTQLILIEKGLIKI